MEPIKLIQKDILITTLRSMKTSMDSERNAYVKEYIERYIPENVTMSEMKDDFGNVRISTLLSNSPINVAGGLNVNKGNLNIDEGNLTMVGNMYTVTMGVSNAISLVSMHHNGAVIDLNSQVRLTPYSPVGIVLKNYDATIGKLEVTSTASGMVRPYLNLELVEGDGINIIVPTHGSRSKNVSFLTNINQIEEASVVISPFEGSISIGNRHDRSITVNAYGIECSGLLTQSTDIIIKPYGMGVLDLTNHRIGNVGTPLDGLDAVNKNYVDMIASTLSMRLDELEARVP